MFELQLIRKALAKNIKYDYVTSIYFEQKESFVLVIFRILIIIAQVKYIIEEGFCIIWCVLYIDAISYIQLNV